MKNQTTQYTKTIDTPFFYKNLGNGRCIQVFLCGYSTIDVSVTNVSEKLMYSNSEIESTEEEFKQMLSIAKDRINTI